MSRLSNFMNKPVVVNAHDMDFRIHTVPPKYDVYFRDLYDKDEVKSSEAFYQLMKASLQEEQDITKEETDKLMLGDRNLFVDAMMEVNGYNKRLESVQERIIAKQSR